MCNLASFIHVYTSALLIELLDKHIKWYVVAVFFLKSLFSKSCLFRHEWEAGYYFCSLFL